MDKLGSAPEAVASAGKADAFVPAPPQALEALPAQLPANMATLALGSIGVVYGDIGTSPLYAFKEALHAAIGEGEPTRAAVLGVASLILWALMIIVTLKYVAIVLYADNNGEGGTLSLMALANAALGRRTQYVFLLGAIGAALFYGDAMITPAISVLSAIEGLKLAAPASAHYVVPLTVVVLIGLFLAQHHGTAAVASLFGPIMAVWFVVIAVAGIAHILKTPSVLAAMLPTHAVGFLLGHKAVALATLGAVFLAVTGAEALYADLGHFGRRPIQLAWLWLVLPSLALNYLGQAALVLGDPKTANDSFYKLAPDWLLVPFILLATAATVIASQAVISGAYSLTRQGIQLGLLPRLEIRHTSEEQEGQIFMPQVNALLLIGVLMLVFLFKSSDSLGAAYGIAVTGTMIVTAVMAFIVIWKVWKWSPWAAAALIAPLGAIDAVFLGANMMKVLEGGWVPLLIGALLLLVMFTWRRGTALLLSKTRREDIPLADLVRQLESKPPARAKGTAVFLTATPDMAPASLMHSLKHFKVLHDKNVILTVSTLNVPRIRDTERVSMEQLSPSFARIQMKFGYLESPNIPKALALCKKQGFKFDIMSTSFILSRRSLRAATKSGMPRWQDQLFFLLMRNSSDATDYFRIPTGRAVKIGNQVAI